MLSSLFPRAHARYTALRLLGEFLEGLCVWLHSKGYPEDGIRRRMEVARLLEAVLRRRRVHSIRELTADGLRACARHRRFRAPVVRSLARSLAQYLEERGELAQPPSTPTTCRVAEYRRHLEHVRGLAPASVTTYTAMVTAFLESIDYDARPARLRALCAADVEAFLAQTGRRVQRTTLRQVAETLRAYLRFLASSGDVPAGIDAHVESPRVFRSERLPRALPWETVQALLRSIDRSTPKGRRDYAMLLLVATYGLRVGEVAGLLLDDVAWRRREMRVRRPKVGTPLLLPLTDEVATALLSYLRYGRPISTDRHLFLRVEAPRGPLQGGAVTGAFHVWARRAEIRLPTRSGPHCLRHALATHLLRQGAGLKTIGDLLGHRLTETTAVYLRLDIEDLREVALLLPATAEVRR